MSKYRIIKCNNVYKIQKRKLFRWMMITCDTHQIPPNSDRIPFYRELEFYSVEQAERYIEDFIIPKEVIIILKTVDVK